MWQEVFRIPFLNIPVYGYGLMMVVGFLAAIEVAKRMAVRVNLDPEVFVNAALIALVTGVAGARLSHIFENWSDYTRPDRSAGANFLDAINIRSGGLTFYGGFLLAFPALVLYAIWKKVPVRVGMDIVAPCMMVGLAFGRIGCFANGCCYGAECNLPWAVQFPYGSNAYVDAVDDGRIKPPAQLMLDLGMGQTRLLRTEELKALDDIQGQLATQPEPAVKTHLANEGGPWANPIYLDTMLQHAKDYPGTGFVALAKTQRSNPVHPAQLYSTITAFMLAALLIAYFTIPHAPGRGFALMLMLEGMSRYILEILRVEPPVVHVAGYGLSLSMVLGIALSLLGVVLWFAFYKGAPQRAPAPTAAAGAVAA